MILKWLWKMCYAQQFQRKHLRNGFLSFFFKNSIQKDNPDFPACFYTPLQKYEIWQKFVSVFFDLFTKIFFFRYKNPWLPVLFELLLWINPVKSLCFVTGVHIGLFVLYSVISKGPLFIIAVYFLFKLWSPIWTKTIWPSIQLPGKYFCCKKLV